MNKTEMLQCAQNHQHPPRLSAKQEMVKVWCIRLLFFLTSCAQYFCLSLLFRHGKQHHRANHEKQRVAFMRSSKHLRYPIRHLRLTFFPALHLQDTKLNKDCIDPSVMTGFQPPTQTHIYTLTGWQQFWERWDRCLGPWEPVAHRC